MRERLRWVLILQSTLLMKMALSDNNNSNSNNLSLCVHWKDEENSSQCYEFLLSTYPYLNNSVGDIQVTSDTLIHPSSSPFLCDDNGLDSESLQGKFVLVLRGICPFYEKVRRAESRGAKAVIFCNYDVAPLITPNTKNETDVTSIETINGDSEVSIPSMMISKSDGIALLSKVQTNSLLYQYIISLRLPKNAAPTPATASLLYANSNDWTYGNLNTLNSSAWFRFYAVRDEPFTIEINPSRGFQGGSSNTTRINLDIVLGPCGISFKYCSYIRSFSFDIAESSTSLQIASVIKQHSNPVWLRFSIVTNDEINYSESAQFAVKISRCRSKTELVLFNKTWPVDCTVELELPNDSLAGEIPTEVRLLTNLARLDLSNNQFSGSVPTELGELKFLTRLDLNNNQLNGSISDGLAAILENVEHLSHLNLGSNLFSGTIPSNLAHLTQLTYLDFGKNQLSQSIPSEIGLLKHLKYFYLQESMISGSIPSEFGKLNALEHCNLSSNSLIGMIPSEISILNRLSLVDFRSNSLTGSIPNALAARDSLVAFLLGQNNISGTLPKAFGANIRILDINNNSLTGKIPESVYEIAALEALSFGSNLLFGSISRSISKLKQLKHIDLNRNRLNGTLPSQIGGLKKLSLFQVQNNSLSGPLPEEIFQLRNLEFLLLSGNNISSSIPNAVGSLTSIKNIDMTGNKLNGTIPAEISHLSSLSQLSLANNQLSGEIPSSIANLSQVVYFDVRNNRLSSSIPFEFSRSSIPELFMGGNRFDLVCDAQLLSWYPEFSRTVSDKHDMNTCSDINEFGGIYPFLLEYDPEAPESHVLVDEIGKEDINSDSLTIRWRYPYSDLNATKVAFSDFEIYLLFGPLVFPKEQIQDGFEDCSTSFSFWDENTFGRNQIQTYISGFQITWSQNETIRNRKCIFAADTASLDDDKSFEYVINHVSAAKEVTFAIRPFNVFFYESGQSVRYVYGPASKLKSVITAEDIPESPPVALKSPGAGAHEITLSWALDTTAEAKYNGIVTKYKIECSNCPRKAYETSFRTLDITGLNPSTEYIFRVRAGTGVGFSNNYSPNIIVKTCPMNMRRNNTFRNCFAESGSFEFMGEGLRCETTLQIDILKPGACDLDMLTVQNIPISAGYWRPNVSHYSEIKRCPKPNYCTPLDTPISFNASLVLFNKSNSNFSDSQLLCAPNHKGAYCFSCEKSFALSSRTGCVECTLEVKEKQEKYKAVFFFLIVVFMILLPVYIIYKTYKSVRRHKNCLKHPNRKNNNKNKNTKRFKNTLKFAWKLVRVKLRIALGFFQVLFAFQTVLFREYAVETNLMSIFGLASGTLWMASFGMECVMEINHYFFLLLYTVPSLTLLLAATLMYVIVHFKFPDFKASIKKHIFDVFVNVSLFIYPGITNVILETFWCEEFETVTNEDDDIFKSALRSDYRISCSLEHSGRIEWMVYASIMLVLFPVGILIFFVYCLCKYKENMKVHQTGQKDGKPLVNPLIYPYKDTYYWFEVYELMRKVIQTAVLSVVLMFQPTLSYLPSIIALNISILFLVILVQLKPYADSYNYVYAVFTLFHLTVLSQSGWFYAQEGCTQSCVRENVNHGFTTSIIIQFTVLILLTLCQYLKNVDAEEESKCERCARKIASLESETITLANHSVEMIAVNDALRKTVSRLKDDLSEVNVSHRGLQDEPENIVKLGKTSTTLNMS